MTGYDRGIHKRSFKSKDGERFNTVSVLEHSSLAKRCILFLLRLYNILNVLESGFLDGASKVVDGFCSSGMQTQETVFNNCTTLYCMQLKNI